MTRGVTAALDSTPTLTRYTFIVPIDRTVAGLRDWRAHATTWASSAKAKGLSVEFDFVGHSAVLAALQQPKHSGAVKYFFDQSLLSNEVFRRQVHRQARNLGDRYSPDVHVPIDLVDGLQAVCISPEFAQDVVRAVGAVEKSAWTLGLTSPEFGRLPAMTSTLTEAVSALAKSVESAATPSEISTPGSAALDLLRAHLLDVNSQLAKCEAEAVELRASVDLKANNKPGGTSVNDPESAKSPGAELKSYLDLLWQIGRSNHHALTTLQSPSMAAAKSGAVVLEGPAGCGKSHLVADFAKTRVAEGLPSILVLGQLMGEESLSAAVAKSVDVGLSGDELFDVIEVAAQAVGKGRALLVIDALNEAVDSKSVRNGLAGFLEQMKDHPWIAVVLTVRDTYSEALVPLSWPADLICRLYHPGLAGVETANQALGDSNRLDFDPSENFVGRAVGNLPLRQRLEVGGSRARARENLSSRDPSHRIRML